MRRLSIPIIMLSVMLSATSHARFREVSADIFHPTVDGGRYLMVHESSTLPQWRFNAGLFADYAYEPLELRYTPSGARRPVIDDLLMLHAQGAVGLTNWLEFGVNVPVVLWETWYDPDAVTATKETVKGLGDITVESKIMLLDVDRYHFGLAIVPFVTIPTVTRGLQSRADPTLASGWRNGKFVSNEQFTGGGKLVIEGDISRRVWASINAGYKYFRKQRQYYSDPDAWIDDTLLLSGGAHIRLTDAWRLVGELNLETVARPFSNAFQSQRQTPMEGLAAVRFQPQNPVQIRGLTFTGGFGRGITSGVGAPDLRAFFGINFRKPRIVELPPPPPPSEVEAKVTEKIIITQKIHFEFNKAGIRAISHAILNDVVELLNKNQQIKKIEIAGHCDSVGSDVYNLRLSQNRAQSVVNYLVSKGVDASRAVAKGYGEGSPIADNNTTEGRAKNRRVEFTVVE